MIWETDLITEIDEEIIGDASASSVEISPDGNWLAVSVVEKGYDNDFLYIFSWNATTEEWDLHKTWGDDIFTGAIQFNSMTRIVEGDEEDEWQLWIVDEGENGTKGRIYNFKYFDGPDGWEWYLVKLGELEGISYNHLDAISLSPCENYLAIGCRLDHWFLPDSSFIVVTDADDQDLVESEKELGNRVVEQLSWNELKICGVFRGLEGESNLFAIYEYDPTEEEIETLSSNEIDSVPYSCIFLDEERIAIGFEGIINIHNFEEEVDKSVMLSPIDRVTGFDLTFDEEYLGVTTGKKFYLFDKEDIIEKPDWELDPELEIETDDVISTLSFNPDESNGSYEVAFDTFDSPYCNIEYWELTEEVEEIGIRDWHDLDAVRLDPDSDYWLENSLNEHSNGYEDYNTGNGWNPIDNFTGNFNGYGSYIRGLFIDRSGTDYVGLFSECGSGVEIKDVFFINPKVTGNTQVGVVTGENGSGSLIEEIHVRNGELDADSDLGGITGNNGGTIRQCSFKGRVVHEGMYSGMIAGTNYGLEEFCFACGYAEGGSFMDGLAGFNSSFGTVRDCWSSTEVHADTAGGIVSTNDEMGEITRCYAIGRIEGDTTGGLVGNNDGEINDSYFDTELTGQTDGVGTGDPGGTGLTTNEMTGTTAETNMSEFDFTDDWEVVLEDDFDAVRDGHPILQDAYRHPQLRCQGILGADTHVLYWDEDNDEWVDVNYDSFKVTRGRGSVPILELTVDKTYYDVFEEGMDILVVRGEFTEFAGQINDVGSIKQGGNINLEVFGVEKQAMDKKISIAPTPVTTSTDVLKFLFSGVTYRNLEGDLVELEDNIVNNNLHTLFHYTLDDERGSTVWRDLEQLFYSTIYVDYTNENVIYEKFGYDEGVEGIYSNFDKVTIDEFKRDSDEQLVTEVKIIGKDEEGKDVRYTEEIDSDIYNGDKNNFLKQKVDFVLQPVTETPILYRIADSLLKGLVDKVELTIGGRTPAESIPRNFNKRITYYDERTGYTGELVVQKYVLSHDGSVKTLLVSDATNDYSKLIEQTMKDVREERGRINVYRGHPQSPSRMQWIMNEGEGEDYFERLLPVPELYFDDEIAGVVASVSIDNYSGEGLAFYVKLKVYDDFDLSESTFKTFRIPTDTGLMTDDSTVNRSIFISEEEALELEDRFDGVRFEIYVVDEDDNQVDFISESGGAFLSNIEVEIQTIPKLGVDHHDTR